MNRQLIHDYINGMKKIDNPRTTQQENQYRVRMEGLLLQMTEDEHKIAMDIIHNRETPDPKKGKEPESEKGKEPESEKGKESKDDSGAMPAT